MHGSNADLLVFESFSIFQAPFSQKNDGSIEAQQKKTKHPISRPKPGLKLGAICLIA